MYALEYEVYFNFIFIPFRFLNLWNLSHIYNYIDNFLNMTLYIDIHAYSLCHQVHRHMHSLSWSKHIFQIVLDSQCSEVLESQEDEAEDTSVTAGAQQSQDLFSAMVHTPLPLNFVHCNRVLIQECTGAGGDWGCISWWCCIQQWVTGSSERGTIPLHTCMHLVCVVFSCALMTAYTYTQN